MARISKLFYLIIGLFFVLSALELILRRRAAACPSQWETRPLPASDPQAFRIVVLGDSIAYAPDLSAEQAWPVLLEKRLQQTNPDRRWQVINAGVAGNTSADAYPRFDQHVQAYHPDLVLIALGLNDCRQVYRAIDQRRIASFRRNETFGFGRFYLYRGILNHLSPLPEVDYALEREAQGPRVPPDTFTSLLGWLAKTCKRFEAQPVLVSLTPIGQHLDPTRREEFAQWPEYNTLVGQVARTMLVPLIDVSQPFPDAQHWADDGIHLSATGETEVAKRVWIGLQPSLTITN